MANSVMSKGQTEKNETNTGSSGSGGGRSKAVVTGKPAEGCIDLLLDGITNDAGKSDRWYIPFRSDNGWELSDEDREEYDIPEEVENWSVEEIFQLTFNRGGDVVKYFDKVITRIDNVAEVTSEQDEEGRWQPVEVTEEPEDYPSDRLYKKNGDPKKHVWPVEFAREVSEDEIAPATLRRDLNTVLLAYYYPKMVDKTGSRVRIGLPASSDNGWDTDAERCEYVRFMLADENSDMYESACKDEGVEPNEDFLTDED